METLSFAFGMLTMVGVALATAVVVGMVKVIKMQSRIRNVEGWADSNNSSVHQRISTETQSIHNAMSDDRRELNQRIDDLNSYVDSRFDKMENKFTIGNSAKKQIIND